MGPQNTAAAYRALTLTASLAGTAAVLVADGDKRRDYTLGLIAARLVPIFWAVQVTSAGVVCCYSGVSSASVFSQFGLFFFRNHEALSAPHFYVPPLWWLLITIW